MPSTSGTATWSFAYGTKLIYTACGAVANESNSEDVPLLWKIEPPGGGTFEMGRPGPQPQDPVDLAWGYSFTEVTQPPPSGPPCSADAGDIHLAFTFDRAERLLTVVDPVPSPDTQLKELTYCKQA